MRARMSTRGWPRRVKALREEGKTQEQIAAELRIAQCTVSAVLRRDGLGGRLIGARMRQR